MWCGAQNDEKSQPLEVSYTNLCTMNVVIQNLWPSFGILNWTAAPLPCCYIANGTNCIRQFLRVVWTVIYVLVSLDMMAAILGFGYLVFHTLNCDGAYCNITVTALQTLPMAFFLTFMMPAMMHSITGKWNRLYGVWVRVAARSMVAMY